MLIYSEYYPTWLCSFSSLEHIFEESTATFLFYDLKKIHLGFFFPGLVAYFRP